MEILLSISRPRALYLVDLVRDKRRFLQGGAPGGSAGAQLGRNLWWIVSRAEESGWYMYTIEWRVVDTVWCKIWEKAGGLWAVHYILIGWQNLTTTHAIFSSNDDHSHHYCDRYDNEWVQKWWSSWKQRRQNQIFSLGGERTTELRPCKCCCLRIKVFLINR